MSSDIAVGTTASPGLFPRRPLSKISEYDESHSVKQKENFSLQGIMLVLGHAKLDMNCHDRTAFCQITLPYIPIGFATTFDGSMSCTGHCDNGYHYVYRIDEGESWRLVYQRSRERLTCTLAQARIGGTTATAILMYMAMPASISPMLAPR